MDAFAPFEQKMRAEGLAPLAIRTFRHYYEALRAGESGMLPESSIEPVDALPVLETELAPLSERALRDALSGLVVIKLNGGLATSMGMTRAKSLLEVRDGECFLDLIAQQILWLRKRHGVALPLLLMNSYRTRDDSLAALAGRGLEVDGLPLDFLQHKVPRIDAASGAPVRWPAQPDYEWCPPGHGDLYTALVTSGLLERLLAAGYRHAFVSNADNLGASVDARVPEWMARERIPFVMEATLRGPADRKGGHLARRRGDGQLLLRESAQCPPQDAAAFQDIGRHRFFNTNNLWLDLRALDEALRARDGVLGLPMIRNEKPVDPRDPDSPRVIQLETAMGAAIACFEGARALQVGRERFAPVKTTADLLAVSSDAYERTPDHRLVRRPEASPDLRIELDPRFHGRIEDFQQRFANGPPSLLRCTRLRVEGDVRFGRGVVVEGDVQVRAADGERLEVPDGARLHGEGA